MDTFENEQNTFQPEPETQRPAPPVQEPVSPPQQTAPQQEAPPQWQANPSVYHGTGTGRKESPYANSPYVMHHQPQYNGYQNHQQPRSEGYPNYQYQPQYEAPKKPKAKKKKGSFWKSSVAVLLVAAMVAGGCLITAAAVNNSWENRNTQMVNQMNQKISDLQKQIDSVSGRASGNSASGSPLASNGLTPGQVYAQNVDSVVAISSTIQSTYFGQATEGAASGSGFILTADGYVVTNYHVVEGATAVDVIMHDGSEYSAKIVGYDSTNDLAVLKVEAENLPAATLGSSDDLIIGDMVVAIGNPLGELTATQTVGYVSGKDREVTTDGTIISMIQTDAAINPGNSGGPLFNMRGEVVGITTAKYSGTTNSGASIEGIGFAIPIDDVLGIISDLQEYGYVTGAYLGVTVKNTDAESASIFGLPTGAYVISVEKDSSADRAGIQPKDMIIDLGGYEVTGITTLTRALRNFEAGDVTTVTLIRGGAQLTLNITLDERPQNLNTTATPEEEPSMPSEGDPDAWYDYYFRRFFGE